MEWLVVIAFLFMSIGLGYAVLRFFHKDNFYDTLLLSLLLGLAMLPLVLIIFRILQIPLNITAFLVLATLAPAYDLIKKRKFSFTIPLTRVIILVVMIIAVIAYTQLMYEGANKYPYLENDDPWAHATGAHYVALEKTTAQPFEFTHYLEPYPPYYTATMGLLHQFTNDLQWVLKFFNALIIGLSVLAAFYLFQSLFKNEVAAAGGAIILGAIPGYMSHFIWAQTLAIPVFLITLWALNTLREMKKPRREQLIVVALLVFSSTIIQPSTAVIFAALFVLFAGLDSLQQKKISPMLLAVVGGGILTAIHWLVFLLIYGSERFFKVIGISSKIFTDSNTDTSGGVVYSLKEFLFPAMSSKIDQATGIGWAVLLLVGIVVVMAVLNYKKLWNKKNLGLLFGILFFVFAFIGTQGNAFPIKLFPHRFWVFLAIAAALLAVQAIRMLSDLHKNHWVKIGIVVGLVVVVLLTILPARLAVQQANWPPGVSWTSQEQLNGYVGLKSLEPTRIFPLCTNDGFVIGFNHDASPWDESEQVFRDGLATASGSEVYQYLKSKEYQLTIIDSSCIQKLGENATNALLQDLGQTGLFQPEIQQQGFILLKII